MINWLLHSILELIGYRKRSAEDNPDERDYKAEEKVFAQSKDVPKHCLLWNGFPQNQGYTNQCSGFSGGHSASIMLTLMFHELHTVNGSQVWNLQIMNGTASEERGDYIQSAPKALLKYGFRDSRGNRFTVKEYCKVKRADFKKYLSAGYPIMTGLNTHRIMCDSNWYWKPGSNTGGHAVCVVGYDDEEGCWYALNSWGKFGLKGSGLFKIKYRYENKLFSPYILLGLKLVE